MGNEKKSMVAMIIVTVIAIAVCVAIIIITQKDTESTIIKKTTLTKQKPKKEKTTAPIAVIDSISEEHKQAVNKDDWKDAGKELTNFLQSSKFKEMMSKQMTARSKAYLKELFEKHGIDEDTQTEIASIIAESQSKFMETMMEAGGMSGNIDDATREKLADIKQNTENQISDLSSAAFLADAKEKRDNEQKDYYMADLSVNLKDNPMSNDQRVAMENLYSENQVSNAERFILSPDELAQRKNNIDNGAKEILSESQYADYKKSSENPFAGMMHR